MTDISLNHRGLRLAASVAGPLPADPARPALLFLHGVSMCRDTWDEVAQEFVADHEVWTLDFRGHGHSDRSPTYLLADFVSDAMTALTAIGRPTIVVGHSLGGCVAGVLAQSPNPHVHAVFLEDPPWYLGEAAEWQRSAFPKVFGIVSARQAAWQHDDAPLSTYVNFVSNTPSPMGGIASDHFGPRHLLSHASALQRQDNRCWGNVLDASSGGILDVIDTGRPFTVPSMVIQADHRLGAALLDGHDQRLAKVNPQTRIVRYDGCGHNPHRSLRFSRRFTDDLKAFVSVV